ncbi:hypothetical protein TRIUR3_14632 [Triticum urartu]|uniref:Uncharacterized protein n=1 Tax=Triticum urartu TaxID=4572 RepID=M7YPR0_TRIUA|nr:hypothetical protein TRIUR3_14632 [Triticum urartu]
MGVILIGQLHIKTSTLILRHTALHQRSPRTHLSSIPFLSLSRHISPQLRCLRLKENYIAPTNHGPKPAHACIDWVVLGWIAPGRSPSSDFMGCGSADELADQEQGFGDALRTDMEYLLLIRRLRRKMELHLKIRGQEEEEDGATLDPKAEEEENEASITGADKEREAESLPRVLKGDLGRRSGEASEQSGRCEASGLEGVWSG